MRMSVLSSVVWVAACGGSQARPDGDGGGVDGAGGDGAVEGPGCEAPPTFAAGLAPTRVLHVDAAAAAGGDGSVGAPLRTIGAAAAIATPGTAIRIAPGVHAADQYVADLRGTATAPIWIGGEPGQPRPSIVGGGEGLHLTRAAYVVVHDLEVTGATANGINLDDGGDVADATAAHHVVVERVYIHGIGTGGNNDCLKVSGVHDLAVYDARFADCGAGGSGVDHVGSHRSVVARSTFEGVMENAVQAKGGSEDVDVRDSRIRISGSRAINLGGSTGLEFFRPPLSATTPNAEARRIRAFNNAITGLGASATPFAFVGCVDCLVAHNLVRGQQRWHLRILQETVTQGGYTFLPASNGRVISNVFEYDASTLATAVNVGGGTAADTFTFATNLWTAPAGGGAAPTLPVPETGGLYEVSSDHDGIPDDPRAPIVGSPLLSSPVAGAGAVLAEVPGTIDGICRGTTASPTTLGPLEAVSAW